MSAVPPHLFHGARHGPGCPSVTADLSGTPGLQETHSEEARDLRKTAVGFSLPTSLQILCWDSNLNIRELSSRKLEEADCK